MHHPPGFAMYLGKISEFAIFLSGRDHSLKEILDHLVRVILVPVRANALVFFQTNEYDQFFAAGHSGISKELATEFAIPHHLHEKYLIAQTINNGKLSWMDGSAEFKEEIPHLSKYQLAVGPCTSIALPIYFNATPVAVMAIFLRGVQEQDDQACEFLKAIGHIFSMYSYRNMISPSHDPDKISLKSPDGGSNPDGGSTELTERQLVILKLISEEHTNRSISQHLEYSESTIRQEIMKIFAKLGCSSRSEAAEIYRGFTPAA